LSSQYMVVTRTREVSGGAGQIALASILSIGAFGVAIAGDNLMLIGGVALAPLAALVAWSRPFVVCSLFIAFSYFRLPEAYPFLVSLKPALLLGTAAMVLVACKALLSPLREPINDRSLKVVCMLSLLACVGFAVPYSFLRSTGSVSLDPILIPVIMVSAAICIWSWTRLLSATGERALPVNLQFFSAFFILICFSTILSRVPGDSFDWWCTITWKVAAMTLAIAWLAREPRDILTASNIFIGSGALIAAVVVYNKINGISLVQSTRVAIGLVVSDDPTAVTAAAKGILSDPNDLALILMFPLAFALARVVHRRHALEALAAALVCALIIVSIIFTQSRGAAIGVIVLLSVLLLQRYRSAVLGLLALTVTAPLLLSAMNLSNRQSSGYEQISEGGLDDSSQHRVDAWKTAVNMAVSRPLTGVGIGNFSQLYYSYTSHWNNREIAVHSMWFQVLAELGFTGFALFVGMIWTSFAVNAKTIRWLEQAHAPPILRATATGLQAALAATCASGTFLSQAYTWPVYVIVAMIAALANQAQLYRSTSTDDRDKDARSTRL
jgi:putative inorganic carbon (hco3(-)) transporter